MATLGTPQRAFPTAPSERFAWIAGDVTSRDDRAAAIKRCCDRFGGLDCLVNNAGIGALGPFAEADEERLRQVFEVNFFASAEFIREALPELRQGRSPIVVNVGSVLGHFAVPGKSEYCASKFALHGLSDALRIELGREEIDVLLVSPSTTSSEFFDRLAAASTRRDVRRNSAGAMTPDVRRPAHRPRHSHGPPRDHPLRRRQPAGLARPSLPAAGELGAEPLGMKRFYGRLEACPTRSRQAAAMPAASRPRSASSSPRSACSMKRSGMPRR